MNKIIPQTKDITTENINKIALLFPQVITEKEDKNGNTIKAIDFELLKQHLSKEIVEGADERYRLDWPGKRASILKANTPIDKTLKPDRESSVNFNETENVYIEGDNFEVLKILQESYLGKIKMIYIDPPYNTGKDFVYKDNFKVSKDAYETQIGTEDKEGGKLFKNTDTNGRFHSDWLSMMYERLLVARDLLTDDGVIFMSIDDNEVHNLRKIADEVFGEENFVAQFTTASNSAKNNSKYVSISHEYLICFSKIKDKLLANWKVKKNNIQEFNKKAKSLLNSKLSEEEIHRELLVLVKYPRFYEFDHYTHIDRKGLFRASDLTAPSSTNFYNIIHPVTKGICKTGTRGWAFSEESFDSLIKEDKILFGKDESNVPQLKNHLFNNEFSLPKSVLFFDSQSSTKWMKKNNFGFDFPKSIDYINYIISMYPSKNFTVLDFFSGSATTAHATMQLNAEDGGNRKFIMVQLPEETDEKSEAFKARYKTITKIGKERIRRAGKKILEDNSEKLKERETPLDIGFRVYKTSESILKEVAKHPNDVTQTNLFESEDNIRKDASSEDILTAVLLDFSEKLDHPIEKQVITNSEIFIVDTNALVACFDTAIDMQVVDAMAKMQPIRAVFRDACFIDDKDLINTVESRFKQLAPNTKVHVI
ncbi:site-specific DNA-methyltransferase [Tenacibaculum finnmarkense]|uniref:site-specific DNA-methyltransferase n=1 Tax=Tenacibaculum finnmarkense TaxID=2781243 RepID=UPI001EFAB51F|nr:site-specific DNA-methyltransferase [Tenacibaculum finnmarkense]MCG8235855.1 site-specific DNA-methyltransferase [Tenacibaculum finnmarkense genomovar ulcerans]MCG8785180.1 site-specific DNA-methyltransferase [Tenacibaculum finnmarkense]MCG8829813.1 site-specific DNA-methyltransferase [Tenacibaculum finnmarkense]